MKFDPLWPVQAAAVARLEVVRSLFALRAVPLYLLAGLPVFVVGVVLLVSFLTGQAPDQLDTRGGTALFYAHLYEFMLRFVVYAGCMWIFMNLFRGEVLDRSLHYYFLAPVRREVLVAGKFVAGLVAASLLFCTTTAATMALLYAGAGPLDAARHLLGGEGFAQLVGYLGVTVLACVGYGAVFLVIGLYFREPILPALQVFLWEQANPFLPPLLKKASVLFYLKSLLPVTIDDGVFAIIADPAPAWLAVPGLLLFTAVLLVVAGLRIRRMEIAYTND